MKMKTDHKEIPGWGMDADPMNEPTYPMKDYTGEDHQRLNYQRAQSQHADVEILMSNERPAMTSVFGNTVPPLGLSGMIRRYAFSHSEDRYRHWLPLIFADRVNVYEGILQDLREGHLPNIFSERGLKMELRHNPKGFAIKLATAAAIGFTIRYLLRKKSKSY